MATRRRLHPCWGVKLKRRRTAATWMPFRPAVSVVIPCRNQARYLAAALQSVAAQTFSPVEAIVVDDGSSDETAEVAQAAGAIVLRLPHSGVSVARNQGLGRASGKYVVFLDADDELEPDAVETGVSVLERNPELWMVARCCLLTDSLGTPLPTDCPSPESEDLYGQWLGRNLVWTPGAAMFRRAPLADMGGFPEGVGPAADYAVYLEFARAGRAAFDPRIAVRYRQHDANMSSDPVRMLRATLEVLRREKSRVPKEHRTGLTRGRRQWCTFYGEQIIQQLRLDLRHRRVGRAQLHAALLLVKECRGLVFTHMTRKARRLLAGHPPAAVEPGRYSPPSAPVAEAASLPPVEPRR